MIWEAHYSHVAGHFRVEKIITVLQRYFYWPKLRHDAILYIQACTTCAIAKPANHKQGLYTPLPVPNQPWHLV